jgi:hypothetical protein
MHTTSTQLTARPTSRKQGQPSSTNTPVPAAAPSAPASGSAAAVRAGAGPLSAGPSGAATAHARTAWPQGVAAVSAAVGHTRSATAPLRRPSTRACGFGAGRAGRGEFDGHGTCSVHRRASKAGLLFDSSSAPPNPPAPLPRTPVPLSPHAPWTPEPLLCPRRCRPRGVRGGGEARPEPPPARQRGPPPPTAPRPPPPPLQARR